MPRSSFTPGKGKYSKYDVEITRLINRFGIEIKCLKLAKKIQDLFPEDEISVRSLSYYVSDFMSSEYKDEGEILNPEEKSDTTTKDYGKKFVLSAWNKESGSMMNIDDYCIHYNLPRKDITSYKLVSHTGTPYYNIVFKENVESQAVDFDLDGIIQKHIRPVDVKWGVMGDDRSCDFDTLTYTDVHIGMDTNKTGNSMYATEWNRESILDSAREMINYTVSRKRSSVLYIDELGDLLDGFNAQTTRGGHSLPQNMSNEEAFDCALEFKVMLIDALVPCYEKIVCNNICNDNHAGSFGYFVNEAFKKIVEIKYSTVEVNNHRQFISHYFAGNVCYLITHGKDDSTLKFGFKPQLDSKGLEKIDQYCKQNKIYRDAELIVFKKGDSHQCLFDMCTSDDFFYFNYPALSPSSQWIQNNFKKGRRGFVLESCKGTNITNNVKFI
jgi:hypothetical protein